MLIVLYLLFVCAYVNIKAVNKTYKEQFAFIDQIARLNGSASQPSVTNGTKAMTPNFKMLLEDLNKRKNLKLNFFDKMLSDEMLSIKKHIQEKNSTFITRLNLSTNLPASTPTLEIKQKWPTLKSIYLAKDKEEKKAIQYNNITNPATKISFIRTKIKFNELVNETHNSKVQRRNKVVEVRSFTDHEHVHTNTQHDPRKCVCANEKTTCTAQSRTSTQCHTCRTSSQIPSCTRTYSFYPFGITTPYSFYPYVITYETPYIFIPTVDTPKERKHKHKHKRPHTHSPKYDYDDNFEKNNKEEEEINGVIGNNEVADHYYEGEITESKDQSHEESLESNRDKLVSNVLDDLKVYYNDAVIKDCYCSSWSNIFQTKCFTFYIIVSLMFFV